jgi:hypothetical protein
VLDENFVKKIFTKVRKERVNGFAAFDVTSKSTSSCSVSRTTILPHRWFNRRKNVKHRLTTVALLLAAVSGVSAQETQGSKETQNAQTAEAQLPQGHHARFEVRPFAGRYIPTGRMSDDFESANTFGVQTAFELSNYVHVLASAGWTDGLSTIGALTTGKTAVWQYDGGVEVNGLKELGKGWLFRPFAGAGAGARSYQFDDASIAGSKTCMNGYAAFGSELQKSVIGFRLESRGYVGCFKDPFSNRKSIRSDAMVAFGVSYHLF